jgi:hypothetical protein
MASADVVAARKKRLTRLTEHPDWPELRAELDRKQERHLKRVTSLLVGRTDVTVLQRELDYIAGFWAGAGWVVDTPDLAEKTLEKALERADRLKEANTVA